MYRGRTAPVEEDYNSSEDERLAEEVAPENLAADLTVQEHLSKDDFGKVQWVDLDIDVTATPAELASNMALCEWKVLPHLTNKFKHNLATKDRHLATGDALQGNLDRCIPLQFTILEKSNSFPFPMALECPFMMTKNMHKNGSALERIAPRAGLTQVNRSVFEPVNFVNQFMYDNYTMCTLEDLESDITFFNEKGRKGAKVLVGSLAYETLKDNLKKGMWRDQYQELPPIRDILKPDEMVHDVQVTELMGKQLKELLIPDLQKVAASFVNIEDMVFKWVRADGQQSFASPKGLAGELVGADTEFDSRAFNAKPLMRRETAYVKARFEFILF
jgi:hypothetical protein